MEQGEERDLEAVESRGGSGEEAYFEDFEVCAAQVFVEDAGDARHLEVASNNIA